MAPRNTSVLNKLGLIVWKNLIIRKRHWLLTIFEFFMPIALFLLIIWVNIESNLNVGGVYDRPDTTYMRQMDLEMLKMYVHSDTHILYAKNTPFYNDIMEKNRIKLKFKKSQLHGYEDEKTMIADYNTMAKNSTYKYTQFLAIIFAEGENEEDRPKHLKYTIRSISSFNTKELFPQFESPIDENSSVTESPYLFGGFLLLQMLIDSTYIETLANMATLPFKLLLQGIPLPPYGSTITLDLLNQIYYYILPLLTTMSFVFLCPSLLTRVVEEKESGIKELMKLMGLKQWMLWLGWVINSLIINVFSITIITVILKVVWSEENGAVLPETDSFLLWMFLFLYVLSGICFCFFLSTLFNKPTIAQGVGVAIWIMSYFLLQSTGQSPQTSVLTKVFLSLLPNMSVLFGYNAISNLEVDGNKNGLQWSTLFETSDSRDMSMGAVYGMLIFDIFFYSLLTWYFDNIKPGQYGIARPYYFPFTKSFWISSKEIDEDPIDSNNNEQLTNTNYEEPPRNLTAGIKINNLRKTYNNVKAVDGLTMNFYNGEITALLGHNGAGKTTTMSILTGMFSQTSGHVSIHDYNIQTQMGNVRNILGLCPQHNMLFTDLNVQEHLIFFAKLKGKTHKEATQEAKNLLNILNLSNKQNNLTKTLSGGMKRKLSLGIALVGDSEVLMLDEPTSGMDPEARREVWDLLLGLRSPDKVIVITTHFMEEADVLGDRIAIMDHGKLQCYGTSMFLKRKYGAGYQLSLMKVDEQTNVPKIQSIVQSQIPNATLKNENAGLITFTLPTNDNGKFPKLFHTLETSKRELHISGIGLSITTLEDVFLRVGEILDKNQNHLQNHNYLHGNGGSGSENGSRQDLLAKRRNDGLILEINRMKILLLKKFLFNKRKYLQFLIFFLIPIILAWFSMIFVKQATETKYLSMPPLDLTLDKYDPQYVYYTKREKSSPELQKISEIYGNLLSKGATGKPVESVNNATLDVGIQNITTYKEMLVIGGEFNESTATSQATLNAMYSKFASHSTGISLNLITNALLKYFMGDEYSISITNHPLDTVEMEQVEDMITKIQIISTCLVFIPLGFLSLVGSFINFPIVERVSNLKQLQLMTGLQAFTYWFSTYLWDLMIYIFATCLSILMIWCFDQTDIFNGSTEIWTLFLLLILYGFSNIAFSYLISYKSQTFAGGFKLLLLTSLLIGMIGSAVTYIFIIIPKETWKTAGEILHRVFSFFPQYALSNGILKFSNTAVNNNKCRTMELETLLQKCQVDSEYMCCPFLCENPESTSCDNNYSISYMTGDSGIQDLFIMLAVNTVLYLVLVLLIDYNVFGAIKEMILCKSKSSVNNQQQQLDPDVLQEQKRVHDQYNYGQGDDNLLVYELEKHFGSYPAVRGISFGVHGGECFGLLGVNGAGKTTTFRMITGDEVPTKGDAIANYYKLSKNKKTFLGQLGYCPQFDALNEVLTGREMLETFACLRGVYSSDIKYEVNKWLSLLGLNDYADRLCGTYSGGNKRKLSTAMALVAEPPIVLLDEPTSGVDPISRRNLWTVLSSIQNKQSIVLTSHSMEECEALCNRLGIMVDGQLTCLGTVPYLKQRFGQGFTVIFKIKSNTDCTNLKVHIQREFMDCELKDEHDGLLNYHIKNSNTTWYQLFETIERLKSNPEYGRIIEDYTVSETTLEQVFLSFAKRNV